MLVANTVIQGTQLALNATQIGFQIAGEVYNNRALKLDRANREDFQLLEVAKKTAVDAGYSPFDLDENGQPKGWGKLEAPNGERISDIEKRIEDRTNSGEILKTNWGREKYLNQVKDKFTNIETNTMVQIADRERKVLLQELNLTQQEVITDYATGKVTTVNQSASRETLIAEADEAQANYIAAQEAYRTAPRGAGHTEEDEARLQEAVNVAEVRASETQKALSGHKSDDIKGIVEERLAPFKERLSPGQWDLIVNETAKKAIDSKVQHNATQVALTGEGLSTGIEMIKNHYPDEASAKAAIKELTDSYNTSLKTFPEYIQKNIIEANTVNGRPNYNNMFKEVFSIQDPTKRELAQVEVLEHRFYEDWNQVHSLPESQWLAASKRKVELYEEQGAYNSSYAEQGKIQNVHRSAWEREIDSLEKETRARSGSEKDNRITPQEAKIMIDRIEEQFNSNPKGMPIESAVKQINEIAWIEGGKYGDDAIARMLFPPKTSGEEGKLSAQLQAQYIDFASFVRNNDLGLSKAAQDDLLQSFYSEYTDGARGQTLVNTIAGFKAMAATESIMKAIKEEKFPFFDGNEKADFAFHMVQGNMDLWLGSRTDNPLNPNERSPLAMDGKRAFIEKTAGELKSWADKQLKGVKLTETIWEEDERKDQRGNVVSRDQTGRVTFRGDDGNIYRVNGTNPQKGNRKLILEMRDKNGQWIRR